ncbi:winged helix DNA-binding protein [Hymenobacter lutimineralis]|uniref:Winged helix DNA-binding protein n=1 Tax=Hymenobacter lutimineralis TaxID=2606448 RepID=A0A5D6UZX4_9BACT|nr:MULTISPECIES: MarR family transcriptional regulator [Hymenobacter]QIX63266.1 winged helix DNA-binding protein [Hymenobacter sp. BT18]TYZ08059.1 winged helix DNA-binding protein [Hymenobacter lutimineralis]
MDYSFLKELLDQVAAYEQARPATPERATLADFSAWLQAQTAGTPPVAPTPRATVTGAPAMSVEAEIGRLLIFLNRYARSYIRLGLAGTPLLTADDFSYLATVLGHQPLTKTEMVALNVHEKASGTEVIKRLLARGLVQEQPHATDRRRKLLTLTEAGRSVLWQVFGRMEQASQLIAGDLTPVERRQLLALLEKLHAFHHPIYTAPRPESFDQLLQWLPTPPEA